MKRHLLFILLFSLNFIAGKSQSECPDHEIEKVYLVFKTHLDIGFTDLGSNVLTTYLNEFIPSVLELSERDHTDDDGYPYRWTTGSWLLWNYMDKASLNNRKRMEKAIERGDFFWHAGPFTLQAEVCDASLFETSFLASKVLDDRFGRTTISMKQTDVPGITRAVVPFMQKNGIKLLHIGTNPCVPTPDVPDIFRWRHTDGSEICVVYKIGYGEDLKIPGTKVAGVLCFTGDNHGAHSHEEIQEMYQRFQKKYPKAEIISSSLDEIAEIIDTKRSLLPLVTAEIGDSWIWGIASDPKKIAELRQMMRLRNKWLSNGEIEAGSDLDIRFSMPLLLIAEHTWGLDVKWNLNDWDSYHPARFNQLLKTDKYRRMEQSWMEKQGFIYEAISYLPAHLQREAIEALNVLKPKHDFPKDDFREFVPGDKPIKAGGYDVVFDKHTGAVRKLTDRSTGQIIADGAPFGEVMYQTFSEEVFDKFIASYCPPDPPEWALMDYGKRGLEQSTGINHATYPYQLKESYIKTEKQGSTIRLVLSGGSENPDSPCYGAPREIVLEYFFPQHGNINLTLNWFDKPKTRIPEAMWISFTPAFVAPELYVDKLGSEVNVKDVVKNGSRHQHSAGDYVRFSENDRDFRIYSQDAPLIALNNRDIMYFNNDPVDPSRGVHYCLYNNCWGTNYQQWVGYDMKFRFVLHNY